jgi:hypothetical protein
MDEHGWELTWVTYLWFFVKPFVAFRTKPGQNHGAGIRIRQNFRMAMS